MPRLRTVPVLAPLALAVLALAATEAAFARHSNSPTKPTHASQHKQKSKGTAGAFDYYVMALSWSPTYCRTHPDDGEQCTHKGYGFILHGLWPEYEHGGGPERCRTDDEPSRKTVATALAFMPSRRLIDHEWAAHGACTGLDPAGYFDLADRAFAAVHAPPELSAPQRPLQMRADDLRGALKRANPGLDDSMLSLHCSHGELVEVRVCLDKNAAPRACGKRMREACPASEPFTIPAVD
ncbi:MAG TPA: ribonuclease T2 [Dokdonella sp.]